MEYFTQLCEKKEDFYGQPISKEALDFIISQEGMLSAVRKENQIHITAFPHRIVKYLAETDQRQKRYYAWRPVILIIEVYASTGDKPLQ